MKLLPKLHFLTFFAGLLITQALLAFNTPAYYFPPLDNNSHLNETPYLQTTGPTDLRYYPMSQEFDRHNIIPLNSIRYKPPQQPEPLPYEVKPQVRPPLPPPELDEPQYITTPSIAPVPGAEDRDLDKAHAENLEKASMDTDYSVGSPNSHPEFITIDEMPPPPPRPLPDDFVIFLEQDKKKREIPDKDTVAVPFQLPYQNYPEPIHSSSKALYERK